MIEENLDNICDVAYIDVHLIKSLQGMITLKSRKREREKEI